MADYYSGDLSGFRTWIRSVSQNTPSTAYEVGVTGLSSRQDVLELRSILRSYYKIYVNLASTQLPQDSLNSAFEDCAGLVKAPSITTGVTDISKMFKNCTSLTLTPYRMPDTITNMESTFEGCTSLTELRTDIPSSVTSLKNTFRGCTSMINMPSIPDTVTSMYGTFSDCTNLMKDISSDNYPSLPPNLVYMDYTFESCSHIASPFLAPSTVKTMNYTYQNSAISSFYTYIPENIEKMEGVCKNCFNLSSASLNNTRLEKLTSLDSAFMNCTKLTTFDFDNEDKNSLTNISRMFYHCTSLREVRNLPHNIKDISATFASCDNLVTVSNIPESVENMYYTFAYCQSLTSIPNIPSKVTNMQQCFTDCPSLTIVPVIPEGVVNMDRTFLSCSSLTSIPNIPETVTNLNSTFSGCENLTRISYNNAIPKKLEDYTVCFANTSPDLIVEVPFYTYDAWVKLATLSELGIAPSQIVAYNSKKKWVRVNSLGTIPSLKKWIRLDDLESNNTKRWYRKS